MKPRAFLLALLLVVPIARGGEPAWHSALPARGSFELRTSTVFTMPQVHRGTLKITDTTVQFLASYTELGAYMSDPSTNYFTDLTVGSNGYLTGGAGDIFIVSGNFTNNSTQNTLWNTAAAELDFDAGTGPHYFALAGADQGATYLGFVNNFAWGIFRLRSTQSLVLVDGNGISGAAFYASRVILDGGAAQVANITGNGASIYYDPTDPGNNYLLTSAPDGIHALAGGGVLAPVQAVLRITSITRLANGHIVLQCLGVPNQIHKIEASFNLITSFTTLATVPAGPDGMFQYEDANAGNFTRRFYRLSYP